MLISTKVTTNDYNSIQLLIGNHVHRGKQRFVLFLKPEVLTSHTENA